MAKIGLFFGTQTGNTQTENESKLGLLKSSETLR
jgi:hypothetical protein